LKNKNKQKKVPYRDNGCAFPYHPAQTRCIAFGKSLSYSAVTYLLDTSKMPRKLSPVRE